MLVHVFNSLFKIKLFVIITLIFRSSLPILDHNPLSLVIMAHIFTFLDDLSFYSFRFWWNLSFVFYLRNTSLSGWERYYPTLFCRSFGVLSCFLVAGPFATGVSLWWERAQFNIFPLWITSLLSAPQICTVTSIIARFPCMCWSLSRLLFYSIVLSNIPRWISHFISHLLFSCSIESNSLWPHRLQHAKLLCSSPSPRACSNSYPLSRWCHPTISSFSIPFSCFQSFPTSRSFPVSQLFASGGQSIGTSASVSVPPMNIQDWFPLRLTGLVSLQSKGLWKVLSNTTV